MVVAAINANDLSAIGRDSNRVNSAGTLCQLEALLLLASLGIPHEGGWGTSHLSTHRVLAV